MNLLNFNLDSLVLVLYMMLPLVISGIFHMIVVKKNYFSQFKIAINKSLFGQNKTYRGFLIMALTTPIGVLVTQQIIQKIYFENYPSLQIKMFADASYEYLGFFLGLAYCLMELPNSFMKRKLKIPEGKLGMNKYFLVQVIFDQIDSGLGIILVYFYFIKISILEASLFILLGLFIHLMMNYLLYLLKLRNNPI